MYIDHLLILMIVALFSVTCNEPHVDSAENLVKQDELGSKTDSETKELPLRSSGIRTRRQFFRKKRKQSPSLMALNRLVLDTVNDTSIAYRNISVILNRQFGVEVNLKNDTITALTATSSNKTTPMFPVQLLFQLLGSNYRGLVRLFNREFMNAVNDSQKNAVRYRKEFRDAVRPYLLFFQWNTNSTASAKPKQ